MMVRKKIVISSYIAPQPLSFLKNE